MECWTCPTCWSYPDSTHKQKVKVLNKKYCWLYPQKDAKKLKKMVPCFDHCKSLYTTCDFKLEGCVHQQIKKLEKEFQNHYAALVAELSYQKKLTQGMWKRSYRYLILTNGVCVKPYPEVLSVPTEERGLCEFQRRLLRVNSSNLRLAKSLGNIRASLKELERRCSLIDKTVESPFILGDWYLKPLESVQELLYDLFKYFYGVHCKFKSWAQLIDPGDLGSVEDYMALLQPSEDYENFLLLGVKDCTCMRTKNKECIYEHVPC